MSEYLRKGEIFPVKGENRAVPSVLTPRGHAFPENMHYLQGELRRRDGSSQIGGLSIGGQEILHHDAFRLADGNFRLMRHTKSTLERYNTGTDAFDDFTGVALTGDNTRFYSSVTVTENDLYLFTNFLDNIRKFDDSAVSTDLAGAAGLFKAKFIEYLAPYVFAAYLEESGTTIPTKGRWSDSNAPEVWNSGNAGSRLFTDDATEIRNVKKLQDLIFVYKEGVNYRGRIVSTAAVIEFILFEAGRGLYSPRALVEADGKHFYMGLNDFHVNNGTRIENIGSKVREFIFNRLNRTKNETCHALHVEEYKEVWFFITTVGEDWPNEVWKYNYEYGFWYKDTRLNVITTTNFKRTSGVTWNELVGTWNQQFWVWDDQSGSGDSPQQVFGSNNGISTVRDARKRNDNGVNYVSKFETVDYTGLVEGGPAGPGPVIGLEDDQEWAQFDFWGLGTSSMISYSTDFGKTWVFIKTKTLTSVMKKHTIFFHTIAEHIRFKIETSSENDDMIIRHAIPYYIDAGEIENP